MSTLDYIQSREQSCSQPLNGKGLTIGLVVAEWNSQITHALRDGAIETLTKAGVKTIHTMEVPGAFELTNGATRMLDLCDSVIVIGCVVRGETPHFDYICQGVTQGITLLNTRVAPPVGKAKPVIFCVLTTEDMAQAFDRAGGKLGNKGEEAAEVAIKMCRPVSSIVNKSFIDIR